MDYKVNRKSKSIESHGYNICLKFFNRLLSAYGDNVKALGWSGERSQVSRFAAISQVADLNNKSILDLGCGFGDFYGFLLRSGVTPKRYVGYDINTRMIEIARKKYPGIRFEKKDILKIHSREKFDYVIESGIFNLKMRSWEGLTYAVLSKMHSVCNEGVAANFLSKHTSGNASEISFYAEPSKILKFALEKISRRVILRHDYRGNDFCVYIYKDKGAKKGAD